MSEPAPVRLIEAGLVPAVRSQAVYHAVAHTMHEHTPDTIILVGPTHPYVSIGVHQELEKEVDVAYCREHDLPIVRREVGGGAVYLDNDQLFVQWIFAAGSLPRHVAQWFELYVQPLIATYEDIGIEASYRPINDIHVDGRKIGGTGAASIGRAGVIVGSFMFDFDRAAMSRVLKISSEKMRDKVVSALSEYMVTMRDLMAAAPARDDLVEHYVRHCGERLGRRIVPGTFTDEELDKADELEALLCSPQWLDRRSGLERRHVKIHEDVRIVEAAHKTPGGLVRVTARLRADVLEDLTLSGDFFLSPLSGLNALEEALIGSPLEENALEAEISAQFATNDLQAPGLEPEDIVEALMSLRM